MSDAFDDERFEDELAKYLILDENGRVHQPADFNETIIEPPRGVPPQLPPDLEEQ
jgi:hypothetical protein